MLMYRWLILLVVIFSSCYKSFEPEVESMPPVLVITSYSIHYTKLYDIVIGFFIKRHIDTKRSGDGVFHHNRHANKGYVPAIGGEQFRFGAVQIGVVLQYLGDNHWFSCFNHTANHSYNFV